MTRLANDMSRCHAVNCERRDECERYIQRNSGDQTLTPHVEHMCGADWFWYIEAEKAGQEDKNDGR